MQNRFVLEGWLFTNFIAIIAYYKIYNLEKAGKLAYYALVPALASLPISYIPDITQWAAERILTGGKKGGSTITACSRL